MPTLQEFKHTTENLNGIQQLVIVARDGTILLQSGLNSQLGNYVAYIAITAEQLKPYLGFTGPYHLIMKQTSGNRIVTILGDQIVVGVELDTNISPAIILDQLAPVVDQITV